MVKNMNKKITLACNECGSRNYFTNKNQTTSPDRLVVKKFCKHCNAHTTHKETK